MPAVVVVGAGVIGLTTAILAQEAGFDVTIVARDQPGDPKSIHYTSPWAGAHNTSFVARLESPEDQLTHSLDKETMAAFVALLKADPKVPLMLRPQIEFKDAAPTSYTGDQLSILATFMPDFEWIPSNQLPEGAAKGARMKTIMIDTPRYLVYLRDRFNSRGGTLVRATLPRLSALLDAPPAGVPKKIDAIANCTGIGVLFLGDVADSAMFPTRGQTVLVRAPWVGFGVSRVSTSKEGKAQVTYIIPRQSGDVILGGTQEPGDFEPVPRTETAEAIMQRAVKLCPELLPEGPKRKAGRWQDLDVIEFGAGLRPSRKGGVRIDTVDLKGVKVVNCYGHAGGGYQASWGSGRRAVELLKKATEPRAKL